MGTPWYATREQVCRSLDIRESARNYAQVDECLAAATEGIHGAGPGGLRRIFYPVVATKYYPWPARQYGSTQRLWLDQPDQLVSLTTATAGGTSLTVANLLLEPANLGPPYSYVEVNRSTSTAFATGDTDQRALAFVGVWGYRLDTTTTGALAEALDASETAIDVTGAAAAALGVGSLFSVESERMIVTNRAWLTTGQTLITTALTASESSVTVNVTSSASFALGESLLLDAERVLVVDIVGNALTVKRAQDGTVLAAHNTGITIYGSRTLTVERGALGTSAATHADATAIVRWNPPALVNELCNAEACNMLLQRPSGWGRTTGSGDNQREFRGAGLKDLRERAFAAHGRAFRKRAV